MASMDRRELLKGFGLLVGGIAVDQAIPFGRVWSFPSEIVVAKRFPSPLFDKISASVLAEMYEKNAFDFFFNSHLDILAGKGQW